MKQKLVFTLWPIIILMLNESEQNPPFLPPESQREREREKKTSGEKEGEKGCLLERERERNLERK